MTREPKVACVELSCIRRDLDKNCRKCMECKPRFDFLAAINAGSGVRTVSGEVTEYPNPLDWVRKQWNAAAEGKNG